MDAGLCRGSTLRGDPLSFRSVRATYILATEARAVKTLAVLRGKIYKTKTIRTLGVGYRCYQCQETFTLDLAFFPPCSSHSYGFPSRKEYKWRLYPRLNNFSCRVVYTQPK